MFNIVIIFLIIVSDQLSKFLAKTYLSLHQVKAVFPGLNWYLTYNRGISFSMLYNTGSTGKNLILGVNMLITTVLIYFLYKETHHMLRRIALLLIIGGALGNIIDRFYLHAVIDFIDVYYKHHHWYTFNIADVTITCGVGLFLIDDIKFRKNVYKIDFKS